MDGDGWGWRKLVRPVYRIVAVCVEVVVVVDSPSGDVRYPPPGELLIKIGAMYVKYISSSSASIVRLVLPAAVRPGLLDVLFSGMQVLLQRSRVIFLSELFVLAQNQSMINRQN